MDEVLNLGGGCEAALGRHAVAALLNAELLGSGFGITPAEVVSAVQGVLVTTRVCSAIESIKDDFVELNERACPLGGRSG